VKKKIRLGDLMQLYNPINGKSLQPTKNDRPKVENDTADYFHAVVAYDLKKFAVAKEYFGKVTAKKQSVFYNEAKFFGFSH
jgi:hypothetical protein